MNVWQYTTAGAQATTEDILGTLCDHYIVCGWNRAATTIVSELQASAQTRRLPLVIVAELEQPPAVAADDANGGRVIFVSADYTSTETLRAIRVTHARRAILLADKSKPRSDQDRDARTILAALTMEKMNGAIHTCAELLNPDNHKVLTMANVEDYVVGDMYMGHLMAHASRACGLVQVLDELLTSTQGNEFFKLPVPRTLAGTAVGEALIAFKEQHGGLIVAVEVAGDEKSGGNRPRRVWTNPPADYVLGATDHLLVIGRDLGEPAPEPVAEI